MYWVLDKNQEELPWKKLALILSYFPCKILYSFAGMHSLIQENYKIKL